MDQFHIFVVEDDPWFGEILEYHLNLNPEYLVTRFESGKECLKNLHLQPSVITLDYSLPEMTGKEVLKEIKNRYPSLPVIIISGQEDLQTAVHLLKEGATDYLVKNDETKDRLWNTLIRIRENLELKEEVQQLRKEVEQKYDFSTSIIGKSPLLKSVFKLMEKACSSNITVSVTGDTGTGKELVAKAIHYNSSIPKKKFISVNVAAIPSELLESELFGHEKGAFTGAGVRRIGKFEEANQGTLFLDEVAEMDINMQVKLLRVLQEREIVRIGSNQSIPIDFRLIIATHKNLVDEVKKGTFREDLFFRLMGLPIHLPPLRERGGDILLLTKKFVADFAKENQIAPKELSQAAKEKLMGHSFRGNVRELKATIELALLMAEGQEIEALDIQFTTLREMESLLQQERTLKEYNEKIIRHFLEKYDQDVYLVAEKLGIGKSTIYRILNESKN